MRSSRKALISAFIVISLVAQVFTNLAVGYLSYPTSDAPTYGAVTALNEGRWLVDTYGFYAGLNGYWRMFSPVHRYDWWWRVIATDAAGRDRDLSTPSYTGRTGTDSFFVDFRETKFLLNLWTRPPMQQAYIDSRCREEQARSRAPASIRLEMTWRTILKPEEAAAKGDHREAQSYSTVMAQRACVARS